LVLFPFFDSEEELELLDLVSPDVLDLFFVVDFLELLSSASSYLMKLCV